MNTKEKTRKKINKLIDGYNQKAEKWGYPKIEFDESTKRPTVFLHKEVGECETFWSFIKTAYRDGYLSSEYDKILKLSRKIRCSKI